MKWLTIEYIKAHSRLDFDCEDAELEVYGTSAENTVLQVMRRTLDNVKDLSGGKVPAELYHAALMLTDVGYTHRIPVTATNLSVVPYTFDLKVANWMRYDKATDLQAELNDLMDKLGQVESDLEFSYNDIDEPTDEQTAAYEELRGTILSVTEKYAGVENPSSRSCGRLRSRIAEIEATLNSSFPG